MRSGTPPNVWPGPADGVVGSSFDAYRFLAVTPSYQLTRAVWWFHSPITAAVIFGLLVGAAAAGLAAIGPPDGSPGDPDVVVMFIAFWIGAGIGSWLVWKCRRRWAECETLTDWERARLIYTVHFGEDPGSTTLATATVSFAAWQRAKLESHGNRVPMTSFVSIQLFFSALRILPRGMAGFSVVLLAAIGFGGWTFHVIRTRERRCTNLWNAEWYSAQRLTEPV